MIPSNYCPTTTAMAGLVGLAVCLWPCADSRAQSQPKPDVADEMPGESADPWDFSRVRPLGEGRFADFQGRSSGLSKDAALGYLQPVDGRPCEFTESNNQHGRAVTLKGMAKLKAPWPDDAVLQVSLDSSKPVKLHFWHPQQGVALYFYGAADQRTWAAYRTTARPAEQISFGDQPHVAADPGLALFATDGRRAARTHSGTYRFQHQRGTLVMTEGDVRLLSVPMSAPPEEVYFEGESVLLRDLAVYRGQPVPEQPAAGQTLVVRGDWPAALRWEANLPPGASLKRLPDGRVRLRTEDTETLACASVPLVRPGLYEVILELEDPSPGSGVCLADDLGRMVQAIGFFRDSRTGLTCFGYDDPQADATAADLNIDVAPAAYAPKRQWLRLVLAGGTLKCFTSGDGRHWGRALPTRNDVHGCCRQVGLYIRPGSEHRRITLRRLEVRRLDALTSLAPVELLQRAETLALAANGEGPIDLGTWQQRVAASQAVDTELPAWRRACAVATLGRPCPAPLANALLDVLLAPALRTRSPAQWKLRLLEEAALLYDTSNEEHTLRLLAHYERLGRDLLQAGDRQGFDLLRRALLTVPLETQNQVQPLLTDLSAAALPVLVYHRQWEDVYRLCRELRFCNQPAGLTPNLSAAPSQLGQLIDWAGTLAAHRLPGGKNGTPSAAWQHPLIVRLSRDAFNIQAELHAALREESYKTANRILTSAAMPQDWGLVADGADGRLFVSLPVAIDLAMRRHPRLREAMIDQFGDVHWMRLHRAMADGNLAVIQGAAVQYHGTPVAAESLCWLADRFLADGRFMIAISRYQQAQPMADPKQRRRLDARIRLAGAMLGREMGSPATEPVDFGDAQMTAAEFEQLIAAMLARNAIDGPHGPRDEVSTHASGVPQPASFKLRPWASFQGSVGTQPEQVPPAAGSLDWPARQIAAVLTAELMIVANRFQVNAYELATGTPKWSHNLGENQGATHAWSLVPMRPTVAGGRVYVRLLNKESRAELVCLELQSGKHLWSGRPSGYIVSDPLVNYGRLLVLTVDSPRALPISPLMLTELDPDTGAVLSAKPLVELGGQAADHRWVGATVVADKIVLVVGGGVLCCDTSGQVRWVRQDPWVPPALDQGRAAQYLQPPLVAGDRVYVAQPGVKGVECVDLDTGGLHWSVALPGVRRILRLDDERLLIETGEGIRALSAGDGRLLWQHRAEHLLDGYLAGTSGGLLYLRRESVGAELWCPVFTWLDVETGQPRGYWPAQSLIGKLPMAGPLIGGDKRLWCFTAAYDDAGGLTAERNIVELIAAGEARLDDPQGAAVRTSRVDEALAAAARIALPDWTLLWGSHDAKTGLHTEPAGAQGVLVTRAAELPTQLARRVSIPPGAKARLLLEVAPEGAAQSKLEIHAGRSLVKQLMLRPASPPTGAWQQFEVDLSAHAGSDVWITIVHRQAGDQPAYMRWKRLAVLH